MHVQDGQPVAAVMDHAEFVAAYNRSFVDSGFFEHEIHRVTKRFGNIAHIFSTYEYRTTKNGPVQGRGVNSIQLFWDGTRWWIAGATWDDERSNNPIPAELR
jgi:hypothetical protein